MAGGTGTANARRAGKYNKPTRGGGKHFSRSLQPVDKDGNLVSIWSKDSQAQSDEDDGSSSSEDEDSGEASKTAGSAKAPAPGNDRDARKAQKKARQQAALAKQNGHTVEPGDLPSSDESDDDADMPANPNHSRAAHSMTQKAVDASDDGERANGPPSRREREAIEAAAAKERYMKLQAQGKTDEAKADMARLKLIREQRAAEAARRQAEKEEKEEQDKMRRAEIEARDAKRREAAAGPKKGGKKK